MEMAYILGDGEYPVLARKDVLAMESHYFCTYIKDEVIGKRDFYDMYQVTMDGVETLVLC